MEPPRGEITQLLAELKKGNREAESRLMPLVYHELRRLAGSYMRRERPDHTLQATALVHEAYMKLVDQDNTWANRSHFFAVAAQVMRRILVDYARSHRAQKRHGGLQRVDLEDALVFSEAYSEKVLALDQALSRLAKWDPRQSKVVELRFFGGLTEEEIAEVLATSVRTVKRDWSLARAWLYGEIGR